MQNQETGENATEETMNNQAYNESIELRLSSMDNLMVSIDRPVKFLGWVGKLAIMGLFAGLGCYAVNALAETIKARRQRNKLEGQASFKVAGE